MARFIPPQEPLSPQQVLNLKRAAEDIGVWPADQEDQLPDLERYGSVIRRRRSKLLQLFLGPEVVPPANDAITNRAEEAPSPPLRAEQLMLWLLPVAQQDAFIGDLEECYRTTVVPKLGERAARRWYWWQAIRSVAPVLRNWMIQSSLVVALGKAAAWIMGKLGS